MPSFSPSGGRRVMRATELVEQSSGVQAAGWRRRRFPRGGTGGSPTIYGELVKSVNAHSRAQSAIWLMEFNADPLLFDWDYVWTNPDALPEDEDYQIHKTIGVINGSYQSWRADEATPIFVCGVDVHTREEENEETLATEDMPYLIVQTWDLAILPGHETTTIDGRPQGPSHPTGNREYGLDGGDCAAPEAP